jgi:4-diphosphocytidyl-2-C-methyl-D-erythritol kinase
LPGSLFLFWSKIIKTLIHINVKNFGKRFLSTSRKKALWGIIRGNKIRTFGRDRVMERNQITTFAYAKVNLALAILNRRTDGYHELQSVMQSIGLCDQIKVSIAERGIECLCGELSGSENLAYRAAQLFMAGQHLEKGILIEIEKNIPVQAGLAGGSSDAAATLRALNLLFDEPYSQEQLHGIAAQLGADVAFCLEGGTQWATGVGDCLKRLPPAPKMDLILIKPNQGVNTGEAYRLFDRVGKRTSLNYSDWKAALESGAVQKITPLLCNDLEQSSIQILPEIARIKEALEEETGCLANLMSGSGSAVFGITQSKEHAEEIAKRFREKDYSVWVTQTIKRGDSLWKES